jgi:hypothetical protein
MRVFSLAHFVIVATLGFAVTYGSARADTRIFSVETDSPGVTVTGVQLNGQNLSEAGRSDARTFFEIDMGAATVPCSNQLAFFASNGQRLEFIVDLCAHNWQVTLPLGAAQTSPPPPPSSPPPPSPPAGGLASLTIYTDDPNVGIEEVHLDRIPMTINFTQANGVSIAFPPGGSVQCVRDLGLLLTDGRRIARMVNICTPNGAVVVALDDDSAAPPPATVPVPPPVVTAPPPIATAPAPDPGGFLVIDNLVWEFDTDGTHAALVYGLPNSDQIEFYASCRRGSGEIDINIERTSPEVRPGQAVSVTFTAGIFAETYNAIGLDVNVISGLSSPQMTVSTDDPIWSAVIQKDFLVIQTGFSPAYALSLTGSGVAARPFLAACEAQSFAAPPPPPVTPPLPVGQIGGDYSCAEESALFSQQTSIQSRLIFRNEMPQTVQLFWLDYDGGRRPRLTLTPGETGVQPTFFTHLWVVTDSLEQCLSIYDARLNDREIVIGR